MNILSIDYGDVRIGLAHGSTEHNIALPLKVVKNTDPVGEELNSIISQYEINHILQLTR